MKKRYIEHLERELKICESILSFRPFFMFVVGIASLILMIYKVAEVIINQ